MSTRTYGVLVSVIGSAIGAWWWTRHRKTASQIGGPERGRVIYDNTPTATDLSAGIV